MVGVAFLSPEAGLVGVGKVERKMRRDGGLPCSGKLGFSSKLGGLCARSEYIEPKTCSVTAMGGEELRERWLVVEQRSHGSLIPSHQESFGLLRVGDECCSGVPKTVSGGPAARWKKEPGNLPACACVSCSMEEGPL